MLPTMTARDCMTRKVSSVRPDDDVLSAVRVLIENRISGAPVNSDTFVTFTPSSESAR